MISRACENPDKRALAKSIQPVPSMPAVILVNFSNAVRRWVGRTDIKHEPRSGRPATATSKNTTAAVKTAVSEAAR